MLPLAEAVRLAQGLGLDLVEVPGTSNPVVAKVVDWEALQSQQRKVGGWRAKATAVCSLGSSLHDLFSVMCVVRMAGRVCAATAAPAQHGDSSQKRVPCTPPALFGPQADDEAARRERLRAKLSTPKEMQFTSRIGGAPKPLLPPPRGRCVRPRSDAGLCEGLQPLILRPDGSSARACGPLVAAVASETPSDGPCHYPALAH